MTFKSLRFRTLVWAITSMVVLGVGPVAAEVKAGESAPELDGATDSGGKPFQLIAYRGKWVMLTFGASWCKPCKKELLAWTKLATKWAGKVTFVAVNIDSDIGAGKKFMGGLKVKNLVQVYAPVGSAEASEVYDPPTMPTTYVISPKGIVLELHRGFEKGDDAKLDRRIAELIK